MTSLEIVRFDKVWTFLGVTFPIRLWEFEDFEFGNDELKGEGEMICSLFVLSFGLELKGWMFGRLEDDFGGICAVDEFASDEDVRDLGIGGETLLISFLCFTTHGWGFYLIND